MFLKVNIPSENKVMLIPTHNIDSVELLDDSTKPEAKVYLKSGVVLNVKLWWGY